MSKSKTIKKHIIRYLLSLLFLICIFHKPSSSQNTVIDSLRSKIATMKDDSSKVNLLAQVSKYYRYLNSDSAIYYANEGLKISLKINSLPGEALCLHNLSVSYWVQENYSYSINYCLKALQIHEQLNDKKGLAKSFNILGILYSDQHYDSLALEYYNRALSLSIETKDSVTICRILGNIGELYESQNKLDLALSYYIQALDVSTSINDQVNISTNLDYLGSIYLKKADYKKAIDYYEKAIEMATKMNDNQNISNTAISLSNIYQKIGQASTSYYYANYALKSAQEINYLSAIKESALILYHLYSSRKDYKNALDYYIVAVNANDSLTNSANEKEFRKIQQKYEIDKKEKEILILSKDKKIAEKEAKNQMLFTVFLLIGVGLLAIFSFYIFKNFRKERKAKLLLASQKAEISEKNEELYTLNEEVTTQRDSLARQRKNTTDSIKYARRIQNAVLPSPGINKKYFPDSFIYNQPKDIVGGDFYWFHKETKKCNSEEQEIIYFALADCTGHGIPGAFMSILCFNIIEMAMDENPGAGTDVLLTAISKMIDKKLRQQSEDEKINDGVDIALCSFNKSNYKMDYSGIRNPIVIIRNHELLEYKPEKKALTHTDDNEILYSRQSIRMQKGDTLFLFSDGFADQFNTENKKKFSLKKFKELLLEIVDLPDTKQAETLHSIFKSWKGDTEQIDDVMVIGIKI